MRNTFAPIVEFAPITGAYAPCSDCPSEKNCNIRFMMKEVREAISRVLDLKTLDQALRDAERDGNAPKELMFYI